MKGRALVLIGAGVLALGACGGSGGQALATGSTTTISSTTTTPTPSTTTTQAGPVAFLAWAHASEMGDRDMSAATDDQLMAVGNQGCGLMDAAPTFGWAVAELTKDLKGMGATTEQVEAMLRQSVLNLCPQYATLVP